VGICMCRRVLPAVRPNANAMAVGGSAIIVRLPRLPPSNNAQSGDLQFLAFPDTAVRPAPA